MGVDYSAQKGIGYKISVDWDETNEHLSSQEFLEEIEFPNGIEYFETGDGNYTGAENEFFIALKNPFANGLDLTEGKKLLDKFIEENKLCTLGEFGLVGGLLVF